MKTKVQIREMSLRDGLQNEMRVVSVGAKKELFDQLVASGISYVETTAFVSPKSIPQLADAEEFSKTLPLKGAVTCSALVPNLKGMERAIASGYREVAVFTAASETFNQKNISASIAESFDRFKEVFRLANQYDIKVRGYISTAFHCPYEGEIIPKKVVEVAKRLLQLGCYEISIGDTIGKATPNHVEQVFQELLLLAPPPTWAGHFHDTYGMAMANISKALDMGLTIFDASVGGLGGCPYAPGAGGNVATEDLIYLCEGQGFETGVNLKELVKTKKWIEQHLSKPTNSKVAKALH